MVEVADQRSRYNVNIIENIGTAAVGNIFQNNNKRYIKRRGKSFTFVFVEVHFNVKIQIRKSPKKN